MTLAKKGQKVRVGHCQRRTFEVVATTAGEPGDLPASLAVLAKLAPGVQWLLLEDARGVIRTCCASDVVEILEEDAAA